jgi:hypothetical protein
MAAAAAATATCEEIHGVVSFLDLAGFTKLTERLALQVDHGLVIVCFNLS